MKKTVSVLLVLLLGSALSAQMGQRRPNPQLASQPTQGQLRELFAGPTGNHQSWLDSMNNWRTRFAGYACF